MLGLEQGEHSAGGRRRSFLKAAKSVGEQKVTASRRSVGPVFEFRGGLNAGWWWNVLNGQRGGQVDE